VVEKFHPRKGVAMIKYASDKMPAFFRVMSPELFFEAEAMQTESVLQELNTDVELDEELEAFLREESP
jgi:hypothetical protein